MKTLVCCCLICLPLRHLSITSNYGYRVHPVTKQHRFHSGTDFRAHNDTVYALISARATVGFDPVLGINIKLANNDMQIIYGHLSKALMTDSVNAGAPIAITGATGRVTGEHLHLTIKYRGQPIDPIKFLYELTIKQYPHE